MIYYAQVSNGEITRINISLPTRVGNTSIPKGATGLEQFGLYPVTGDEPAYDQATQRMAGPTYAFNGTAAVRQYTVENIPPEEIAARIQAEIVEATQARLDSFAKERNYDSIHTAAAYGLSKKLKYKGEGQSAVDAMTDTWDALYAILAEVQAGTRPMPTSFEDIEPDLPVLTWSSAS